VTTLARTELSTPGIPARIKQQQQQQQEEMGVDEYVCNNTLRVLPAHSEDVPTPQSRGNYVKTYAGDVSKYRTPKDGAHPSDGHISSYSQMG
jgi:hypothetical protein